MMSNIFSKNLKVIKLTQIRRNPDQPRKYFNKDSLEELKQSIIEHGVISPISVKKTENYYQIVAGERRYRAAHLAGLTEIPCVILSSNEQKCALISLVENIQRCDLDFVEEALAYKKIITDYSLKQETFALNIGKTQSAVANKLRILKLPTDILEKLRENGLTERHARALLRAPSDKHYDILNYIIENSLNVAKTEEYIDKMLNNKKIVKNQTIKIYHDVRLFINTINQSLKHMHDAGIDAKVTKDQTEETMTYTIVIPMKK